MDFVPPFVGCRWGLVLGRVDVEKGGSVAKSKRKNFNADGAQKKVWSE